MKMEILLEPTSNKLMVEHAEYDESNTYVLERFNTTAGNPVKKILLKLNLSDHRLFKDGGGDDDFTSSDEESLSDEDVLDENDLLVHHLSLLLMRMNVSEIDAFLDIDVSTDIEDGYHDSEGDIIYLKSLLINDTIHNLPSDVFIDHDPKSLKDEPDNDNLKSMVKVFDPGIWEKKFSPTYVRLPFEDRHYLPLTYVIRIFLPYLTYSMDSSVLLSSRSKDTIFDPGISAFHFSSLEPVASHRSGTFMCFNVYLNILNESPMEIFYSTCFVPNIMMIWGESS
ncbi:hypothetical protein Tco_0565488 [Tanacetum coccineum]